ncbi:MAG: hypothetical protein JNM68_00655 [Dinghuibacter sp.]|nr:hypothetical protein [Dinghuibacter sp.]
MNSEKHNSWQQRVQEYQAPPAEFDAEASWRRLQQRGRVKKWKRLIPFAAAACLAGTIIFVNIQIDNYEDRAYGLLERSNLHETSMSLLISTGGPVKARNSFDAKATPETVTGNRDAAVVVPSAFSAPAVVPTRSEPGITNPQPALAEQIPAADTAGQTPVLVRNETVKPATKPTMRIVHINELNNVVPAAMPAMAAEPPAPSRFPFGRSSFARNRAAPENAPGAKPEVQPRRGLLRSMASIKDQ